MYTNKTPLSDKAPFVLVVHNDESVWEYVYYKYASILYGIIFHMTGDELVATQIFKAIFLEMKEKKVISKIHYTLSIELLRHTYQLTLKHLKMLQHPPVNTQPFNANYPLINLLCFEKVDLQEVSKKLAITEQEVLQKLREEFNQLRNIKSEKVGIM